MIRIFGSSICIQLLLFHNNQKNVYSHSFPVTLEFLELSCSKALKRHQKSRWEFYLENTNSISVDDISFGSSFLLSWCYITLIK